MIEINSQIYKAVASELRERIGDASFFNGTVEYETDEFYSTLTLSAIVRRKTESLPEGPVGRIADIIPVWWEFSTVQQCGEVLNDFSFPEFKTYVSDYD